MKSGKIIIITAPSGSGKTTLVKRLMATNNHLTFSVSACTRNPREGEVDGKDYYFFTEEKFKQLIADDAFIEWEMVYPGKYYGTLKSELDRIWEAGKSPLVDIDVQGALAVMNKYKAISYSIFIEAPSIEVLRERLLLRGTETPETLAERVDKAEHELMLAPKFDKIVINDNLDLATNELISTVEQFLKTINH